MASFNNKELDLLWSRVEDGIYNAENHFYPTFLGFLDENEQSYIKQRISKIRCHYKFFGGYDDSTRCFLGIFPTDEMWDENFPIRCLKCEFKAFKKLSHRDFLGSLMGLMMKREAVGDICVLEDCAYLFLTTHAGEVALRELSKIGKEGVKISEVEISDFKYTPNFLEIVGSVSSLRLDCVVAFLCGKSRSNASSLISQGLVGVNGIFYTQVDKTISSGDKISVRGVGKFVFVEEIGKSKKDKLRLKFNKYQ